jgi:hypothetical protein
MSARCEELVVHENKIWIVTTSTGELQEFYNNMKSILEWRTYQDPTTKIYTTRKYEEMSVHRNTSRGGHKLKEYVEVTATAHGLAGSKGCSHHKTSTNHGKAVLRHLSWISRRKRRKMKQSSRETEARKRNQIKRRKLEVNVWI